MLSSSRMATAAGLVILAPLAATPIYAYRLATGTRDANKDFDTLSAAGNNTPAGLWSDGTTMWVADRRFRDNA